MNYWKVILATVVIFGAGVVTGGLLVNFVDHPHSKPAHRATANSEAHLQATNQPSRAVDSPKPLRPTEILSEGFLKQLDDVLHLEPAQLETIKKIIADGQEQNHEIWTNSTAQMRKVMQDTRRTIREQLTPAQQKQFEDLLKQFRAPRRAASSTNAPTVLLATNSPTVMTTNLPAQ